jgi:hypothetical protein
MKASCATSLQYVVAKIMCPTTSIILGFGKHVSLCYLYQQRFMDECSWSSRQTSVYHEDVDLSLPH